MKRPIEPMFWTLFGGGGALSALFLPALLVLMGFAIPLGWINPSYDHLQSIFTPWYSRLLLLGIVSLSMFHWAHRFRFTLHEGLQLHPYDKPIAAFCYGLAGFSTGVAAYFLFFA
jgi:fumarate reductase subunit D